MAEVRSLQSQLHKVNGRRASGDRMILPLSSMSEVLGIKTVLLSVKQSGIAPPSKTAFFSIKEELRTQATSTPVGTIWNSVRVRSRIILQSKEVVKLGLINSPTVVIKSLLNISQNIFVLVMSRAFLACLENGPQYSQSLLPDSSSFSKGWPSSSVTALRDNTGFFLRHARCPPLHLAKAVSFSVCVQGRFVISAWRSARVSRVIFAMIWLSLWKSTSHECPKMSVKRHAKP